MRQKGTYYFSGLVGEFFNSCTEKKAIILTSIYIKYPEDAFQGLLQ